MRKFPALGDQGITPLFQLLQAVLDLHASAQQLVMADESCLVEVDNASLLGTCGVAFSPEPGELRLQQLVGDRLAAARHGVLAGQEHLRAQQDIADLFEDECVELVGTDVALRASAMFTAGPDRIVVAAIIIAMERAVAPAHPVAEHAHAAMSAPDQPAKQPVPMLGTPGVPARVVAADALDSLEHRFVEDCRHFDRDPLIARASHLPVPASLSALRHEFGPVVVSPADIGLVVQEAAQACRAPVLPPHWRADAIAVQPDDDLAHRDILANILIENAAHDGGLGLEHLQMRRARTGPGDAAISVWHLPIHHFARAGTPQLAAPIALDNLCAFILGNDALHLGQQPRLRIVLELWRVMEPNAHAVARQLVEYDELPGIHARQAVGRQTPYAFKKPSLGAVAQRIKTGPVQACTGQPLIRVFGHQFVSLADHPFTQNCEL